MKKTIAILAALACTPSVADAFCGFYVAGGDQQMFNDATQVVLMRQGTRTVLSMQNNYKGPPEAFAMVIPVPTVLREGDVKTLERAVFEHVDKMGAPRLVEYWEQDPCGVEYRDHGRMRANAGASPPMQMDAKKEAGELGVTIEAKFVVGEYQVLILSAKESTGLATWLEQEKYKIPEGAAPLLRPYIEAGMKFFVAKVDPTKVKFENGRAALSPLRFHYDSDEFALPIRLGLANSSGAQDLIVNILAPHQRYEVKNYPNATIPTNIDVRPEMREKFAAFYTALFDRTVEKNPNAVITEYAWQATTCDPCPGPALNYHEFHLLGADVLDGPVDKPTAYNRADFVLTRLHARYGKSISDDLRFVAATPIVGGREFMQDNGKLEERSRSASTNNFQGRYAIRHAWTGAINCDNPVRNRWGGPPGEVVTRRGPQRGLQMATDLAFAPRNAVVLADAVKQDIPEVGVEAALATGGGASPARPGKSPASPDKAASEKSGCGCSSGADAGAMLVPLGAALALRRRRRKG